MEENTNNSKGNNIFEHGNVTYNEINRDGIICQYFNRISSLNKLNDPEYIQEISALLADPGIKGKSCHFLMEEYTKPEYEIYLPEALLINSAKVDFFLGLLNKKFTRWSNIALCLAALFVAFDVAFYLFINAPEPILRLLLLPPLISIVMGIYFRFNRNKLIEKAISKP